jgi:hypothetical protein
MRTSLSLVSKSLLSNNTWEFLSALQRDLTRRHKVKCQFLQTAIGERWYMSRAYGQLTFDIHADCLPSPCGICSGTCSLPTRSFHVDGSTQDGSDWSSHNDHSTCHQTHSSLWDGCNGTNCEQKTHNTGCAHSARSRLGRNSGRNPVGARTPGMLRCLDQNWRLPQQPEFQPGFRFGFEPVLRFHPEPRLMTWQPQQRRLYKTETSCDSWLMCFLSLDVKWQTSESLQYFLRRMYFLFYYCCPRLTLQQSYALRIYRKS